VAGRPRMVAGRPARVAKAPPFYPEDVVVELKREIVEGKGGKEHYSKNRNFRRSKANGSEVKTDGNKLFLSVLD
jgi:ribosomal protein L6P/L9E